MSNVRNIDDWWTRKPRPTDHTKAAGPPEPPDPPDMELTQRVTKIETTLSTLTTKVDLVEARSELKQEMAGLRTDVHREFTAQTWRIVLLMVTLGASLTAAAFFIARFVHPA